MGGGAVVRTVALAGSFSALVGAVLVHARVPLARGDALTTTAETPGL